MNKLEGVNKSLVAIDRVTNSFKPDVQVMVQMRILSSLLPQLFLLS